MRKLVMALTLLALPAGCDDDENNVSLDLSVAPVPDFSVPGPAPDLLGADLSVVTAPDMTQTAPMAANVQVQDNMFSPSTVTVAEGGAVTWTWMAANPHTVTSQASLDDLTPDGRFCSGVATPDPATCAAGPIQANGSYRVVFDTAGTYPYYCRVHGLMMQGTVEVVAPGM